MKSKKGNHNYQVQRLGDLVYFINVVNAIAYLVMVIADSQGIVDMV